MDDDDTRTFRASPDDSDRSFRWRRFCDNGDDEFNASWAIIESAEPDEPEDAADDQADDELLKKQPSPADEPPSNQRRRSKRPH